MNNRKYKKKKDVNNVIINGVSCNVGIDYDKLAEAIVKAQKRVREEEEKNRVEERAKEKKERQNIIGYKEYPENEKTLKKIVYKIINESVK